MTKITLTSFWSGIAVAVRTRGGEGIAALGHLDGDELGRLLDGVGIVDAARLGPQQGTKRVGRHVRDVRADLDLAEMVLLAFLDGEGDDESLRVRIVFPGRGDDADVDEAVFEIVAPQQVAIDLDAVGIVDVVRLQEAQPVGLAGLDDVLETLVGEGLVADEHDLGDAGLGALVDLEDEVDAAVRQFDDLGRDARRRSGPQRW